MPDELDLGELEHAINVMVTWGAVMLFRRVAPQWWERIGGRVQKLIVVGLAAVCVAVASGILQDNDFATISRSALSALAGAVLLRQVTKGRPKPTSTSTLGSIGTASRRVGYKSKSIELPKIDNKSRSGLGFVRYSIDGAGFGRRSRF